MKSKRTTEKPGNAPLSLRDKAEKRLAQSSESTTRIKANTPEKLVHELQVHQIELEMQNEELRDARLASDDSRDKYMDLYDLAPIGYFTLTRDATIKEVNLTGSSLLGIERGKLVNLRFTNFIAPAFLKQWDRYLTDMFVTGEKQHCDVGLQLTDLPLLHVRIESVRIADNDGVPVVMTAVSDITDTKRAEEERDKLINELKEALANIKILKTFLPICAYCKKIRDDKGYWEGVETYISKHTDTVFSHGACPECAEKVIKEIEEFKKTSGH